MLTLRFILYVQVETKGYGIENHEGRKMTEEVSSGPLAPSPTIAKLSLISAR